jgi:uncharacterized repeat protein (TIGR03803 family)
MKPIVSMLNKPRWSELSVALLLCAATASVLPAQTFTTLYTFCLQGYPCLDGASPGGLIQATNGDLYGTTGGGGSTDSGTIFKITPSGALATLYTFCTQRVNGVCPDGASSGGLVQATNGDLYGTTSSDGAGIASGTIFKITMGGKLTTLYRFCAQPNCADGATPQAALVQATNGDVYGTTASGGGSGWACGSALGGCGTVFKMTLGGALTTLYSFCSQPNCADGGVPGPLVQATNGDLYGTTTGGGLGFGGTVFKITPGGKLTTLYSFCSQYHQCPDGSFPAGGLVQASDGNLYGTTVWGGVNLPPGSVSPAGRSSK